MFGALGVLQWQLAMATAPFALPQIGVSVAHLGNLLWLQDNPPAAPNAQSQGSLENPGFAETLALRVEPLGAARAQSLLAITIV